MNLPRPLSEINILRRRQLIRKELEAKVEQLRHHTSKLFWILKCPCDFTMCDHMHGLTVDLHLDWHPLEAELGFFLQQPYQHLGILLYPHCIECCEPSICGESRS